jgi:ABC-type proline/glycine betaine transport system permease subunit
MPRLAPTEIVEQRITFGNYERQFVTDVKNDIQKGVTIATITAAAVPVAAVAGLGLLGYGIYRGMNSWAFGDALDTAGSLANVSLILLNKVLNPFAWINDL